MVASGDPVNASDITLYSSVAGAASSASGTTTSTAYTAALTGLAVTGVGFIAPPSGIVAVLCKAVVNNNTAGSYSIIDFEIRQGAVVGAGTIVRGATDNTAGVHQSTTVNGQGTVTSSDLITGLTPGAGYNIQMMHKLAGGGSTASFNRRQVMVLPQLG
jgi:hypothetical protein